MESFAAEIGMIEITLIIPLGVNVSKVLNYLAGHNYLDANNMLLGFPHPSGEMVIVISGLQQIKSK
ncbi:hypothetical protein [Peribacillus phoenicis]|uniref:hypothetical protein n=1 Tax=Peribacillus sp. 1P06PA-2 TaxID=3132295 RepID=UPI0039A663C6